MKSLPLLALMLAWAECSAANAASLSLTQNGNIFSLYIAGEEDNGNFDTVDVAISPTVGATFVNIDGGLDGLFGARPAGQNFTFINRFLGRDPVQGGEGWTVLGFTNTATGFGFAGGPLGRTISTADEPGGRLFLANMVLSPPSGNADARVQLISAGNVIEELRILFVIPEPATITIAGLGLVGVVAASRRKV
jgi:hypothetical protein